MLPLDVEKPNDACNDGRGVEYSVDELDVVLCLEGVVPVDVAVPPLILFQEPVKVHGEEQDEVDDFDGQDEEAEEGADFGIGPVSLADKLDRPGPDIYLASITQFGITR